MKFTLPSGLIGMMILLLFTGYTARGQQSTNFTPLNFIENKGQWDPQVLYKSDVGTADIWLRKTGFTFMLYSKEDMHDLFEYMHGHGEAADSGAVVVPKNSTAAKAAATATNDGPGRPRRFPDVRGHAYQVNFVGANENPEIIPEKPQESLNNYLIGNDRSKWASNVKSYQGLMYKSLYPGIDAHVYSDASQLKYDLIIAAGANPDKVQLAYDGATGMEIKKGQLLIHTTVGDVIEQLPYAYQYVNNQRVSVKVSYKLNGNKVGFKISGDYDPAYPLVIDPVYVFSTVSGSRADNWGFTATYDDAGNFYGGGIVFNPGYPATPGAYKTAFNGGTFDIAISKFNPNGTRLIYATYLGGDGQEQPHSLFVDPQGNLVISGRTTSANYPYDKVEGTNRGGWDIVVTKLNATGSGLIGSLIVAGGADDGVNMRENRAGGDWVLLRNYGDDARSEVVIDDAGYIYVASCTRSSDFPVTPGVFQGSFGGSQDGVVMKINPMCRGLVWSSYLGGSAEDAAYVIALNKLNTLYVAGGTASSNFSVTPGALYSTYRGGVCDGFITHIANDGSRILQSTFLGSNDPSADQVYGIQLDKNGFVYAMGTTEGTWPVKLLNPGDYNDNSLQYIVKMQPDLSAFVYSTTFGKRRQLASTPSISPTAFLVDRCENVYVSGWGGGINNSLHYPNSGTFGLPAKNPVQSSTDGMDFYFFVLQRDAAAQLFGSWFGGNGLYEHVDGGTSRFDRNGVIYQGLCAWCNVSQNGSKPRYPTTPGAYSSVPPPACNYGALKIAFNLDGVKAGIKTLGRRTNYCVPSEITFVDTTRLPAERWEWHFPDGTVVNGKDTIKHTFNQIGTFRVMLVKVDRASCNGTDTAYIDVKLGNNEAKFDFDAQRQPPCEALAYVFTSNATPAGAFRDSSFIFDLGDGSKPEYVGPSKFPYNHKFAAPGVYNVSLTLVDTNFCNAPQTITKPLRVAVNVTAQFNMPDTVCVGTELQLDNTTLGGESFLWTFEDNDEQSTEPYPIHKFAVPGRWKVKLLVLDENTCNKKDSITKTVLVAEPPVADFDFMPTKATENTPVTFTNLTQGQEPLHYLWNFGDGDTTSVRNPQHQYLKTGTYNVCLTAANREGCTHTVCKQVTAIVVPLFDVPTAFSPNNDGMNDVFYVKSFGVTKFNLKIFNRWGQLIFESSDPRIGWDGRFKGAVQPMDAYAYVVSLEFTDGTKANKTGNVTLLR